MSLLKGRSEKGDPFKFRILEAGKRFFNIIWDSRQIGSLVSTARYPVQMYLKGNLDKIVDNNFAVLSKYADTGFISDARNKGHYGTGDIEVNLEAILESEDHSEKVMNDLFLAFMR